MNRRQLIALFICNTMPSLVGNSLLPLLPVYVRQMGGGTSISGIYLALAFGALAAGTLASNRLADWVGSRKTLLVLGAVIGIAGLILMGLAANIWLLTLVTMAVWFMGGVGLATTTTLAGIYARPEERGRIFGILTMSVGVAQITGGILAGRIVDAWGYMALFTLLGLVQFAQIIAALLLDERAAPRREQAAGSRPARVSRTLWLLMAASILIYVVVFSNMLGLSVAMTTQGFNATAISSTIAIGGVLTVPLPLLIGWLSDRFERRTLLALCYAAPLVGALLLAQASELWHFWLVQILFASTSTTLSLGAALVTDLTAPDALGGAMSRFNTTRWIGGVIGFSGSGVFIQALGFQTAFMLFATLPLISIVLILAMNQGIRLRAHSRVV